MIISSLMIETRLKNPLIDIKKLLIFLALNHLCTNGFFLLVIQKISGFSIENVYIEGPKVITSKITVFLFMKIVFCLGNRA